MKPMKNKDFGTKKATYNLGAETDIWGWGNFGGLHQRNLIVSGWPLFYFGTF